MNESYDIPIRGEAERRRVRAEIVKDGPIMARSSFIELGPGDTRAGPGHARRPRGRLPARQATNVGSNVHEDLARIDLVTIRHGTS
jgi:hypothetical protein